jgi:uncharacterized repeat protein (TIGR01451 family)
MQAWGDRVRGLLGSAGALVLAGAAVVGSPEPAEADPGHPGTPHGPTVLFTEDFENVTPGTEPLPLPSYVSAAGQTYTADAYWLSLADCNGFITDSATVATPSGCSQNASLGIRDIDDILGVVGGHTPPATNHAVAAHTDDSQHVPGPGLVEFKTVNPVPLSAPNRFITFSVDVASRNCRSNHARLELYVLDGTNEIPAFSSPIDVCTDPRAQTFTGPLTSQDVVGGTYVANGAVLATTATLAERSCGVVMRNRQGQSVGNDHGYDNIRCLDATPQLDKSFSPVEVPVGQRSTLTFTVTNTTELASKRGWSFTDLLPAGLTLADPVDATTDCPNGVVTAAPAGDRVRVTGDLDRGQLTCTVSVAVTSGRAGRYENTPDRVTTAGLDGPRLAPVTFTAGGQAAPATMAPTGSATFDMVAFAADAVVAGSMLVLRTRRRRTAAGAATDRASG